MSRIGRIDRYQRRRSWLGFPLAVIYKFVDDRGPQLAALIAYYGFISLFPLLLLFVTILGYVAAGNEALQKHLLNSALVDFPIVGTQLRDNVHGFTGSGTALVIGILGTLYGGIGVMQVSQSAFNRMYGVPRNSQPNPFLSRLRSLGLLVLLGTGVLITSGLSVLIDTGAGIGHPLGIGLEVLAHVLAIVLNAVIFTAAFQLLVAKKLCWRQVALGGIIAGTVWYALQTFGAAVLSHELTHSRELYGTFGLVLGTLAWIYLEALAVIFCVEANVVLDDRLWPRALLTPFTDNVELTDADRRAYCRYACSERHKGFERIDVSFKREQAKAEQPDEAADGEPVTATERVVTAETGSDVPEPVGRADNITV